MSTFGRVAACPLRQLPEPAPKVIIPTKKAALYFLLGQNERASAASTAGATQPIMICAGAKVNHEQHRL